MCLLCICKAGQGGGGGFPGGFGGGGFPGGGRHGGGFPGFGGGGGGGFPGFGGGQQQQTNLYEDASTVYTLTNSKFPKSSNKYIWYVNFTI